MSVEIVLICENITIIKALSSSLLLEKKIPPLLGTVSTQIAGCLETSTHRGSSGHLCCQRVFVFTESHCLCLGMLGYPMNQWFGLILKG